MARVKRSRSRSRDFHREQQKPERILVDPEQETEKRREKRQEQLKNDKRFQRKLAKEAKKAQKSEEDVPELTPRERAARRRTRLIYFVVLAIVLFFLGRAAWKAVEVKQAESEALAREEHLKTELEKLRGELSRIESDEYVEEKARTELHMIFPGETLYIVRPKPENQ